MCKQNNGPQHDVANQFKSEELLPLAYQVLYSSRSHTPATIISTILLRHALNT